MGPAAERIDPGLRKRLTGRFGSAAEAWLGDLPALLASVAERWPVEIGSPIPRGTVSAVFRCRLDDGRGAVLKASPDRQRLETEAAALAAWRTPSTPAVIAFDAQLGALLLEEIEPGTPLADSAACPAAGTVAGLLNSLHGGGRPDPSYPGVAQRADYLFASSAKLYDRHPGLGRLVPAELYGRGHRLAIRLAHDDRPAVLLHGDLTPGNILDGGRARGLVAIDPAPCTGDAEFDAVDLILWQALDTETICRRAERVGEAAGLDAGRLLAWCSAFAALTALEAASETGTPASRLRALLRLAAQADLR